MKKNRTFPSRLLMRSRLRLFRGLYRLAWRFTGRYNKWQEEFDEADALAPGTRVTLPCRRCSRPDWQRSVVWTVKEYKLDAGDYFLTTRNGPKDTKTAKSLGYDYEYAKRECMRVV
jgi:hypothetical protein